MRTRPPFALSALLLSGALLTSCAHGGSPQPSSPTPASAAVAAPPRQVRVRVLALNDFHGHLAPPAGSSGEVRTGAGKAQAGG
ncbi:MAG TPA: hypothetical protein VK458_23995, partial [Myxococcaceae bacterium]|nr:hypothetical protein [Myxococcaceae bacterium]